VEGQDVMSAGENKQFIGRYLQALSGQAKPPSLVERFVSDATLAEHISQAEAAFPFYELIADDLVAEGDVVALRGTFQGVHGGPFAGIEATGRSVSANLMIFYRIEDGRITQHWMEFDVASVISQLTAPVAASV
jgi:predicted ester cyclase